MIQFSFSFRQKFKPMGRNREVRGQRSEIRDQRSDAERRDAETRRGEILNRGLGMQ
jgi:hypothetical protein